MAISIAASPPTVVRIYCCRCFLPRWPVERRPCNGGPGRVRETKKVWPSCCTWICFDYSDVDGRRSAGDAQTSLPTQTAQLEATSMPSNLGLKYPFPEPSTSCTHLVCTHFLLLGSVPLQRPPQGVHRCSLQLAQAKSRRCGPFVDQEGYLLPLLLSGV